MVIDFESSDSISHDRMADQIQISCQLFPNRNRIVAVALERVKGTTPGTFSPSSSRLVRIVIVTSS